MSTTYYALLDGCDACGRAERYSMAHTAGGWNVTWTPYEGLAVSVAEWAALASSGRLRAVRNEYGDESSFAEFLASVERRKSGQTSHIDRFGGYRDADGWEFHSLGEYGEFDSIRA